MWYQQPIRPLDPVIEDDPQTGAIRYIRDNFTGTGQDSYTQPPAQDQSQWQTLNNILPITDGSLRRRWPLTTFNSTNPGSALQLITRLYSFQRDSDLSRRILACGNGLVESILENGTIDNPTVFTPIATPRVVVSRSSAYFLDGYSQDNKKWDASILSNWGIDLVASSAVGPIGPNFPTVAQDITPPTGIAWANVGNLLADDGALASVTINPGGSQNSHLAKTTGYNFSVSGAISGIKVEVKADISRLPATAPVLYVQLLKNGVAVGPFKTVTVATTNLAYFTFGGGTDLWGASWTAADINNANFGVQIEVLQPSALNSPLTINVDAIRVTVYASTPAVTFTASSGDITLTVGRTYYYAFKNSNTGHYSDLSVASSSTGPQTNQQFLLSVPQPADPQVDTVVLMATADGGDTSILYQLAEVPVGTLTYTDSITEPILNLNQQLVYTDANHNTFGLALNTPPPTGNIAAKHKGRLWIATGQYLYFSKSIDELTLPNGFIAGIYEEAWPKSNFFDISPGAETVTGLLSDGNVLFIGTQFHVRRLLGDDPTNFQEPEILHPQVGVLNQEVWQIVYVEGSPMGAMWLTPDNRVVASDGNNVGNVGIPIQDLLNSINSAAINTCWATFASNGPHDVYILAIPTGTATNPNTLCVFDLRGRRWYVWSSAFGLLGMSAGLYNVTATGAPQWLVAWSKFQNILNFDFTYTATEPTTTLTAQTSWMHLGSPTYRKLLDEIEVIGDSAALNVTVEGASTQADFASPHTVVSGQTPVTSPFGQAKVYLATAPTLDRYYRFTFNDNSSAVNILNGFNVRAVPFHTL